MLSTTVIGETITVPVVSSTPVMVKSFQTVQVPVRVEQCASRREAESRGWIQKGTNEVFGSTGGLVGALVGGAIGSRIGKGNGKTAATVLGVVIGNRVGQGAPAETSDGRICREVTTFRNQQEETLVLSHYNVNVKINEFLITLHRKRDFRVGEGITLTFQ